MGLQVLLLPNIYASPLNTRKKEKEKESNQYQEEQSNFECDATRLDGGLRCLALFSIPAHLATLMITMPSPWLKHASEHGPPTAWWPGVAVASACSSRICQSCSTIRQQEDPQLAIAIRISNEDKDSVDVGKHWVWGERRHFHQTASDVH